MEGVGFPLEDVFLYDEPFYRFVALNSAWRKRGETPLRGGFCFGWGSCSRDVSPIRTMPPTEAAYDPLPFVLG
jgi:hypothetical protein